MFKIFAANLMSEPKPSADWKLGTVGKIGFFLLTWSFVTQFGIPTGRLDTSAMANETLVWRLLLSRDVTMRGMIKLEMPDYPKKAENVSKAMLKVDQPGEVSLEGLCNDSISILVNHMWFAYAVLMLLELYILIKLNLKDEKVIVALLLVVGAIVIVAAVANQAPNQTIDLWVIDN